MLANEESMTTMEALRRATAAAAASGVRAALLLTRMWPEHAGRERRVETLGKLRAALTAALPDVQLHTMFNEMTGSKAVPAARARTIEAMRDGSKMRLLLLHDGKEEKEQITGLDLGFIECILSVGVLENPQQAYARAMRASDNPPKKNVLIVRIGHQG